MGDLNRAELLRRLEALEQRVGTGPGIPGDVERFAHFSDALLFHCEGCRAVNVPVDVWDVGRRVLQENGYETVFSVVFHANPAATKDEEKARWKLAEDRSYALLQVLDALPSIIAGLREGTWIPAPAARPAHPYQPKVPDHQGCEVSPVVRVCERGTVGCVLSHTGDSDGQGT